MPRKSTPSNAPSLDKINNWIKVLRRASVTRTLLVQHKRDADVLRSLHVQNIYYEQEPEFKVIEALVDLGKECILLYDANRAGNTACARMRSKLEHRGVKINTRMRKILFTTNIKELGGFLRYLHESILSTPRKHEATRI